LNEIIVDSLQHLVKPLAGGDLGEQSNESSSQRAGQFHPRETE